MSSANDNTERILASIGLDLKSNQPQSVVSTRRKLESSKAAKSRRKSTALSRVRKRGTGLSVKQQVKQPGKSFGSR